MNKFLNLLLKTAVCVIDQSFERVDRSVHRTSDRISEMVDQGKRMIDRQQDHTVRNAVSFAAGVAVGIGTGLLWAPASGKDIRTSIKGKVQEITGIAG